MRDIEEAEAVIKVCNNLSTASGMLYSSYAPLGRYYSEKGIDTESEMIEYEKEMGAIRSAIAALRHKIAAKVTSP